MKETVFDVIVVGAGFSGLCASYYLKKYGLSHLVFERGRIGESWRSQRWDSFRFNSTNKLNILPGEIEPDDPDAFGTVAEFLSNLERYVQKHLLPVLENSQVTSVEKNTEFFEVSVSADGMINKYLCKQLLIASGAANKKLIPLLANNVPKNIIQLHTCEYKNTAQLPEGGVLVVGGAQSGIQITEDLLDAGRKVFLSTSAVGRIPRWYRGKDIFYWVVETSFYDIKAEEVDDPKLLDLKPPHVSGTGDGKSSLSLQSLSKRGAIILGTLNNVEGESLFFQPNAAEHIRFADEYSKSIKKLVDEYIDKNKLDAPPPHPDEADIPDIDGRSASSITSLDMRRNNINTIIWATGFGADYSYIKLPVFDSNGKLFHKDGIPGYPGLYFLGYPWLRSRKSPILFGIIVDAIFVTGKIYEYFKINSARSRVEIS